MSSAPLHAGLIALAVSAKSVVFIDAREHMCNASSIKAVLLA